jgi:ATP-dependent DNA helicase RecG
LKKGNSIFINGEVEIDGFKVLDYEIDDGKNFSLNLNRIVPIYPATEKIDNKFLRKLIHQILNDPAINLPDFLPQDILDKYKFFKFNTALKKIHFPNEWIDQQEAYFRLAFNEFFMLELILMQEYHNIKKVKKTHTYELKKHILTPFKNDLKFELTIDQKKVINEIFNDMLSDYPMNRLLQGDVGSGKTVVALSAMLLATENKQQSAIMAPTEVLAKQHYLSIKNTVEKFGVRVGFLAGSTKEKDRKILREKLENNEIDIIIGTHALFSENINFSNLKLIVIDEQHKFGVKERLSLRQKAKNAEPDILVMSATPIPRTLAMSVYGDLDISSIKTMPKNRKPIDTFLTNQRKAIEFLITEIEKGRQGYIIYPAVDEDNKLELKSAEEMFKKLKTNYFQNIEIGMLHGKMKPKQKDEIMQNFVDNKIKILIATTVVEVGVNVQNASVMIIEHAERFGLSTLHQLRGRIGRGEYKSSCFLVPAKMSPNARERLSAMLKSNDGFFLAEKDLEIRGPGEFLGKNQHGFIEMNIGDITKDLEIIELAKKEALLFFKNLENKKYTDTEIKSLDDALRLKYGEKIDFFGM